MAESVILVFFLAAQAYQKGEKNEKEGEKNYINSVFYAVTLFMFPNLNLVRFF